MIVSHCPSCHARFRINDEQLQQGKGLVRCGRCRNVFDAVRYQEESLTNTDTVTAQSTSGASSIFSSSTDDYRPPAKAPTPDAPTIKIIQQPQPHEEAKFVEPTLTETPPAKPVAPPEPAWANTPAAPAQLSEIEIDVPGLTGLSPKMPVAPAAPAAAMPSAVATPPAAPVPSSSSVTEPAPTVVPDAPTIVTSSSSLHQFSANSKPFNLPAQTAQKASKGLQTEPISNAEKRPEPRPLDDLALTEAAIFTDSSMGEMTWPWIFGCLLLAVLALVQLTMYSPKTISQWLPPVWVDTVCGALPCSTAMSTARQADKINIQVSNLERIDSSGKEYRLSLLISNEAGVKLEVPSLRLQLRDQQGNDLERLVLPPKQWLAAKAQTGLAPNDHISSEVTLALEQTKADNYRIDFVYQ